jgi:8-oxo-dGTP pyrophosphatase MutT (NUDIX family)
MKAKRFLVPVAVHLLLIKDGRVLLLRRFKTGYEDGNYALVAGHVDRGESVIQTMVREALEEANLIIAPADLQIALVMQRKSDDERIDYFFTCKNWQGEIKIMEPHKCDELRWVSISKLPANTIPFVKRAIKMYLLGEKFDIFGY